MSSESASPRWREWLGSAVLQRGAARERMFWILQAVGWCGVAGLSIYPLLQIFNLPAITVIMALRVSSGVLLTCGLRWLYRRLPWREIPWWRLVLTVVALCMVLGTADSMATHWLAIKLVNHLSIGADASDQVRSFVLLMGALLRCSIFLIWSLLYFGLKIWLDAAEARLLAAQSEAAARTSELKQLQAQVNPHFLFNALNSILAEKDNSAAVEQITQELAEYLRFSLRPATDRLPLGEELQALEHYLRVEKARFEEKLWYEIEASPEAREVRVPVATVQPLLENAMKYGRRTSPVPLKIHVSAELEQPAGLLRLRVENTGRWLEFDGSTSHGIGLSNLRRRLELLFGPTAGLSHREEGGWVKLEVVLPAASLVETPAPAGS